jgi:hypothetical protein
MKRVNVRAISGPVIAAMLALTNAAMAEGPGFGLPARCALGVDCFVQQFADMKPGPEVLDPFCGIATYDGHDGLDLRVRTMADVARGVDVLAVADGTVLRVRDDMADHVMRTEADRAAITGRDCGNGIVIRHADGVETQYCHLKQGSVSVAAGEAVTRGQSIGQIGASGAAAFPHVHVTVRRDGKVIEPMTGTALGAACDVAPPPGASLFAADLLEGLGQGQPQLLWAGFAAGPVDETALVDDGMPPAPSPGTPVVAWGWAINLAKGDVLTVRLKGPDGAVLAEQATEPMPRSKASYLAFSGVRVPPGPGTYMAEVALMRGGTVVFSKVETAVLQ